MSRVRWTEFEGKKLILQWQESGMDKSSFCKAHGIAYGRFLYWCKRSLLREVNTSASAGLVRLEVVADRPSGKLTITGPNDLILHLEAGEHSVSFIKALLTA